MTKWVASLIAIFLIILASHWAFADVSIDLQEDIRALAAQIEEASKQSEQYAGGLVKSLILLRIEILKTTKTLLEQRLLAKNYNVAITYNVAGEFKVPEPAPASVLSQLEAEIAEQKIKLAQQERENAKYRGGLIKAMILSNIATIQNTIALLEQRKLLAKYGIPYPLIGKGEEREPPEGAVASPESPKSPEKIFEIIGVDTRVTESNQSWWRFAWRLTLKNFSDKPIAVNATVEFQDKDGFVIDQDSQYGLMLAGGEQKTFTGFELIRTAVAPNVAKVGAKVRMTR